MILEPREGPYMGVVCDEKKVLGRGKSKRTFRVLAYTAYNAMGLIGTECHGICVLDEDRMAVTADELYRGQVGYPALEAGALRQAHAKVMSMTAANFRALVNTSGRNRYRI